MNFSGAISNRMQEIARVTDKSYSTCTKKLHVPIASLASGGCSTTCMIITPPRRSPMVIRESASVLLSSKTLPACMIFTSFTDVGVIILSVNAKSH